jgi:hypothetical protein
MPSPGTTSLPKGKQVTGIILTLAIASGIPMMVTACAAAVVK